MTSILLVDDHILSRLGLAEAIESSESMEVIADASNGDDAIKAYLKYHPDVVMMDFRMPGGDGAQTTARLLKLAPEAKVLMLSVYEGEEDIWRAVNAGVKGYLTKGADTTCILDAVSSVARGETYFPAKIAKKIEKRSSRNHLTPREIQVLELLVQGFSNKEMCIELSLSIATIKLHISNLFEKMEVSDRTQAAVAAVQRGILHLDD